MGEGYSSVMDVLYRISMWIAGLALLVMVAVIPVGIFARYVMNSAVLARADRHIVHGDVHFYWRGG